MKGTLNRVRFCLGLLLLMLFHSSHVGSPGVIYEGLIGSYRILAYVNPPDVIPGIATVEVILPEAPSGLHLEAKPVYWSAGLMGTPEADMLEAVPGDPGRYQVELWLMQAGVSSVYLSMREGNQFYEITIPVMAVATAQKDMPEGLGLILSALGLFLVVLMVTIIAASLGDSLRTPGEDRSKMSSCRSILGLGVGVGVMVLVLVIGKLWWDSEAADYQRNIFKPIQGTSSLTEQDGTRYLNLTIGEDEIGQGSIVRKMNYMVPDHGKLMHLFLIKKGELDVFAHLHPQRLDSMNFRTVLPDVPPGDYHVFADITRYTGFSETIVSEIEIPNEPMMLKTASTELGRDDTFTISNPVGSGGKKLDAGIMLCGKPGLKTNLPGGYSAIWEADEDDYEAGRLYSLDFALMDKDGNPAALEPYMGMMGHAVVLKHDGTVYVHLHPTGNYSMGSQEMLVQRFETGKMGYEDMPKGISFADSVDRVVAYLDNLDEEERNQILMAGMYHPEFYDPEHEGHSMVSFPYAFPEPGEYRIWLQVKIDGEIINGAFDVDVKR